MALTERQYLTKIKKKYGDNIPIDEQLRYKVKDVIIAYGKRGKFTVDELINKILKKTYIILGHQRVKVSLERLVDYGYLDTDGVRYWNTKKEWSF